MTVCPKKGSVTLSCVLRDTVSLQSRSWGRVSLGPTWNTNQYAVEFAKQPESAKLPGDLATCTLIEQDEIPTDKSIRRLF